MSDGARFFFEFEFELEFELDAGYLPLALTPVAGLALLSTVAGVPFSFSTLWSLSFLWSVAGWWGGLPPKTTFYLSSLWTGSLWGYLWSLLSFVVGLSAGFPVTGFFYLLLSSLLTTGYFVSAFTSWFSYFFYFYSCLSFSPYYFLTYYYLAENN